MSKKSGKGKKSNKHEEVDLRNLITSTIAESFEGVSRVVDTEDADNSVIEIGYLIGAILDYYEATGRQPLDDGDEWKRGTEHEPGSSCNIPKALDDEIMNSFLIQIKKFQK